MRLQKCKSEKLQSAVSECQQVWGQFAQASSSSTSLKQPQEHEDQQQPQEPAWQQPQVPEAPQEAPQVPDSPSQASGLTKQVPSRNQAAHFTSFPSLVLVCLCPAQPYQYRPDFLEVSVSWCELFQCPLKESCFRVRILLGHAWAEAGTRA